MSPFIRFTTKKGTMVVTAVASVRQTDGGEIEIYEPGDTEVPWVPADDITFDDIERAMNGSMIDRCVWPVTPTGKVTP